MSKVNTWGYYQMFLGDILVHPNERNDPKYRKIGAKVLYCAEETDDGYLVLLHGDERYVLKPDGYSVLEHPPKFKVGDVVKEHEMPGRIGTIRFVGWHFNHQCEFYMLRIGGRESTKWHFGEDLEPVEES